jgi:hypothetical protein
LSKCRSEQTYNQEFPSVVKALFLYILESDVVSISLASGEFGEVELPADDTVASVTLRASGKVTASVQASHDGRTWPNPCASTRLNGSDQTLPLNLPQGTRMLRILLQNSGGGRSASVQIDDLASAVVEA